MAKFMVQRVAMVVGPKATGGLAKFRGKTLHESVEFVPARVGFTTDKLRAANPEKFGYVADKLEAGKTHKAYSISKVAKYANANLLKVEETPNEKVGVEMEKVAGIPAEGTLEDQMAAIQAAIFDRDMAEAIKVNAEMDAATKVGGINLPNKTAVQRMKRDQLIALVESLRG